MNLENKKQISDLLEKTRQLIVSQGSVVDDRLLRREINLESMLDRLESISSRDMSNLRLSSTHKNLRGPRGHYVRKPASIKKDKEL